MAREAAHFAAIVESSADAIVGKDLRGIVASWNPGAERIFGYAASEMIGQSITRLIPPELQDEEEHVLGRIREGKSVEHYETVRVAKNGRRIDISLTISPIRNSAGEVVGVSKVARDISRSKEAERKIEHFADLFQSLSHHLLNIQEEERRHLARELHDEIGQSLTAAKLNLKLIAADVAPAVAGRFEDSVQLLDRLHEQVRQLSLDLRPPLLDELGLVPALRWLTDQQAQRSGLRVTFTANVERLEMDPPLRTACFRVSQEAITNALQHARAATVAVKVQAEPDRVWLVVQDDGVGFYNDAMQQRAKGGASVGLLSMNERVSLLGGELEVNSAPGRGTEIRAWLPLAPPARNVSPEKA